MSVVRRAGRELASCFAAGLRDSVAGREGVGGLVARGAFARLALHNLFFAGSFLLYRMLLVPFCRLQLEGDPSAVAAVARYLFGSTHSLLLVAWLAPMYLYSAYANAVWHADIATFVIPSAAANANGTAPVSSGRRSLHSSSSGALADVTTIIYKLVIYNAMLVFSVLSGYTPFVGPLFQAVLYAWLYSVYCFEFRWKDQKMSLLEMIDFFESRWVYFVGFGTPLTVIAYAQSSFFTSYPTVSILIPFFILTASNAGEAAQQTIIPRMRMREVTEAAILRPLVSHLSAKRAKKRQKNN